MYLESNFQKMQSGVLADLDPPGPNPLVNMDPRGPYPLADLNPLRGFGPLMKLSENRYQT